MGKTPSLPRLASMYVHLYICEQVCMCIHRYTCTPHVVLAGLKGPLGCLHLFFHCHCLTHPLCFSCIPPSPQAEQTLFGLWGHSDVWTGMQPQRLDSEPLPLGKVTDFPCSSWPQLPMWGPETSRHDVGTVPRVEGSVGVGSTNGRP